MTVTKPRFVWSFDFGQVLQTATFLIAVGGLVWYQAEPPLDSWTPSSLNF